MRKNFKIDRHKFMTTSQRPSAKQIDKQSTPTDFKFDLFLSHSSKDKSFVRPLAERLRADGVRVWFDEWEIRPGDSIPAKIEEGLELSRVLALCMSKSAFGADWVLLESFTYRFRDPLNKDRRFIPLRIDDSEIKGSLQQFLYIDLRIEKDGEEYKKLIKACVPRTKEKQVRELPVNKISFYNKVELLPRTPIRACAFDPHLKFVLTASADWILSVWNIETGERLQTFRGHTEKITCTAWSGDSCRAISGSLDGTARLWDISSGHCLSIFKGHTAGINSITWNFDGSRVVSASDDKTIRVWEPNAGKSLQIMKGHNERINCVTWNSDSTKVISGSDDMTVRIWSIESGKCLRVLEGHQDSILSVAISKDQNHVYSASKDRTTRIWDVETGMCLNVLNGHTDIARSLAWSHDKHFLLSGSHDQSLRLWDINTGRCLCLLKGHGSPVLGIIWKSENRVLSCDSRGVLHEWDLSKFISAEEFSAPSLPPLLHKPEQIQYTNAKVLLVGESSAGKTGLSMRLASDRWEPSDSTVGAWATQWKLPVTYKDGVDREIWLWDFGGQADQRLIHQLFMDETSLAILVFDGQKEDIFETLGQWDRDLSRATRKDFAKLLVAGRVDAGGLRVSRNEMEKFSTERGFRGFLETSAKTNLGCDQLKKAILEGINWEEIPCRTTEVLFKRLKEEIIRLKDDGRVLMRFNELYETLQIRLAGEFNEYDDKDLHTVLTLLAGPCVVWELSFGSWVLLQPERINAYAQAVIRTLQSDEHQRGCLMEERVLNGDLVYDSSMPRLLGDEERFVLLAMHQTLVGRGLCLRQSTDKGNLLVFPSYYRRERPDLVGHPAVLVNFRFSGFLDEIYATLVVRLHHCEAFDKDDLWRRAADFTTKTGKQLGIKLTRRAPGVGDLEVYFDPSIPIEEKIIFSKYIYNHLQEHALNVERLRHYVCPNCGTAIGNRDVAMKRLNDWLQNQPPEIIKTKGLKPKSDHPTIICVACEKRVQLWDELEQCFVSPMIQKRVREMQTESNIILDNESKERALVGEVISTVALAGQLCREFNVSDHGIDMEIEFKNDDYEATGAKLYLQLKSGDSYLRKRSTDEALIFSIKEERHARYWIAQKFPVMLVLRSSTGELRWMEIREQLRDETSKGKKPIRQIVFEGERFDVMSVRRWRERILQEQLDNFE